MGLLYGRAGRLTAENGGSRPGQTEKCLRFDDQSENASIHHNVVYNCGTPKFDPSSGTSSGVGLVAKGDGHLIYANTIFHANASELCLSSCVEKLKAFRKQYPRVGQNVRTRVFNTAAARSVGRCGCPSGSPPGGNFSAVFTGADLGLADVAAHDYRPASTRAFCHYASLIPVCMWNPYNYVQQMPVMNDSAPSYIRAGRPRPRRSSTPASSCRHSRTASSARRPTSAPTSTAASGGAPAAQGWRGADQVMVGL
jgi:hypothetical protein